MQNTYFDSSPQGKNFIPIKTKTGETVGEKEYWNIADDIFDKTIYHASSSLILETISNNLEKYIFEYGVTVELYEKMSDLIKKSKIALRA
jgi:hypothetical protein